MWKDGEGTKLVNNTKKVVYDYKGQVYCCCPETTKGAKWPPADLRRIGKR